MMVCVVGRNAFMKESEFMFTQVIENYGDSHNAFYEGVSASNQYWSLDDYGTGTYLMSR